MSELISVLIPVYNCEKYLREAIKSIYAQTYSHIELIVIDDGSTDQSGKIARSFPHVKYLYQENQGAAAARNRGIKIAQGEFIAFLDADDLWLEDKLSWQYNYLKNHSSIGAVMGLLQRIPNVSFTEGGPNLGAILFRKTIFEKLGDLDESQRTADDFDFLLRMMESGIKIALIKRLCLYYRMHENNMTRGKNLLELNVVSLLHLSIKRRKEKFLEKIKLENTC